MKKIILPLFLTIFVHLPIKSMGPFSVLPNISKNDIYSVLLGGLASAVVPPKFICDKFKISNPDYIGFQPVFTPSIKGFKASPYISNYIDVPEKIYSTIGSILIPVTRIAIGVLTCKLAHYYLEKRQASKNNAKA